MRKIVIVGGGTAGWMSAVYLPVLLGNPPNLDITLVESPNIPTIGVGEGSTPVLGNIFKSLGISESDWMPEVDATYKVGIDFENWLSSGKPRRYFHPFYSDTDFKMAPTFHQSTVLRRAGHNVPASPDDYLIGRQLAQGGYSPLPGTYLPFEVQYGYHFNATKLAAYWKKLALRRGVRFISATVNRVMVTDEQVQSVHLDDGSSIAAEVFIDCTGQRAELIRSVTDDTNWFGYESRLFNDRAVTVLTDALDCDTNYTSSIAMSNGWRWRIPLRSRTGNGYVYSSRYQSDDDARYEFLQSLQLPDNTPVRTLTMKLGRRNHHWVGNVIAVGLSSGFIEPLEATALALTQQSIERLAQALKSSVNDNARRDFNEAMCRSFDAVCDYVGMHYLLSDRSDTKYWNDARTNGAQLSSDVKAILAEWFAGRDLSSLLRQRDLAKYYSERSWHAIFAGSDVYPEVNTTAKLDEQVAVHFDRDAIDEFQRRILLNFPKLGKQPA